MPKKNQEGGARSRVLVLVDESNVGSSVRTAGRGLDWLKLRDFLAGPNSGRDLIEMVVYAGLPPAIPTWQDERDRKNKFVHWLRSNGFMVERVMIAPSKKRLSGFDALRATHHIFPRFAATDATSTRIPCRRVITVHVDRKMKDKL